jgi:hypothetical protein
MDRVNLSRRDISLHPTSGSLDRESRRGGTLTVGRDRYHPSTAAMRRGERDRVSRTSTRQQRQAVSICRPLEQADSIQKNIAQ